MTTEFDGVPVKKVRVLATVEFDAYILEGEANSSAQKIAYQIEDAVAFHAPSHLDASEFGDMVAAFDVHAVITNLIDREMDLSTDELEKLAEARGTGA